MARVRTPINTRSTKMEGVRYVVTFFDENGKKTGVKHVTLKTGVLPQDYYRGQKLSWKKLGLAAL